MNKPKTISYEKGRLRELLWLMILRHQPVCPLCKKPFVKDEVLPTRGSDQLTEHHIDLNHYNDDPVNKCLVHRSCHKGYHTSHNINFWSLFR